MRNSVCFDDVLLTPQYSTIKSRKEVVLDTNLKNIRHTFRLPIISSPMDTITEGEMVLAMFRAGGLGIIHRYNTLEEQVDIASCVYETLMESDNDAKSAIAAAVGITGDYMDRATALYDARVRILCVDVAHGHHITMKSALNNLRAVFGNSIHIMAGNVATLAGFDDLADWGADSIRVGIGGGSICSTRIQTGHGMSTLQSIFDCARTDRDAILVADGGIRSSGDIVKAIAAGADFVMVGSLLSGTDETPGEVLIEPKDNSYIADVHDDGIVQYVSPAGRKYKKYRGMASPEAQIDWRGFKSSEEGVATTVDYKGPVIPILQGLGQGVRSGLSYSGARSIREFQAVSKFTKQTYSGVSESSTHIFER